MNANTVLIRLEGPLQAWGDHGSKFVIRRTREAPTKSGVLGMLCAALGIPRDRAEEELPKLNALRMGVRVDRPPVRWWDYHTVGARTKMRIAKSERETKPGAMLTRREYLADASFLVALRGDPAVVQDVREALANPVWPTYLGRKCCPPSVPLVGNKEDPDIGRFPDLASALCSVAWRPRLAEDQCPTELECLLEWRSSDDESEAPTEAEVWYDAPRSFDVPGHSPRLIVRDRKTVGDGGDVPIGSPRQTRTALPPRPRADYTNTQYRRRRQQRIDADRGLCVFCKGPATTVQHLTYRRAGGGETPEDLRSLCRLCHDAVTMIEYGLGMGLDRINPEDPRWRGLIIAKRDEIVRFRSLQTRRRRLQPEEVE